MQRRPSAAPPVDYNLKPRARSSENGTGDRSDADNGSGRVLEPDPDHRGRPAGQLSSWQRQWAGVRSRLPCQHRGHRRPSDRRWYRLGDERLRRPILRHVNSQARPWRHAVGVGREAVAGSSRPDEEPPVPKWMGALDGFSPPKAFGAGVILTGLNPKNLLLIVAGAAAVAGAGASTGEEVVAWTIFTLIAIVGVSIPVVISFAMGDRSDELLVRLRGWMARNNGVIMAVILLLIGAKLLGDGISGL